MRYLVVADFHGVYDKVPAILHKAGIVDGTLLAGDLTEFGPVEQAKKVIDMLPRPIFAVPGNCDPRDIVRLLQAEDVNLHQNKVKFDDVTFIGIGGSNPTPFNTPFEASEEEIKQTIDRLLDGVSGPAVLISHAPPKGHGDTIPNGVHVGSTAVAEVASKFVAIVCGHIHEDRSVSKLGKTVVVNPGPAMDGNAAILDVEDGHAKATLL